MKIKILWIASLCFLNFSFNLSGQNQYNTWYFGDHAGIDFNSGAPVSISNSSMFAFEGCAVMCDSAGNILFYSNGGDHNTWDGGVWNRNHVLMPNGNLNGFNGCNSADQSALIIPDPANSDLFYLFTQDCIENALAGGFRFSVIDMSLDGGNGDITIKDSLIETNTCEAMCGIRHSNGIDFWVLVHKSNTTEFKAFLVNSSGIQPPVSSFIGTIPSDISQLKANAGGNRICYAQLNATILYDFDNSTGILSNMIDLARPGFASSFAPGGNLLYILAYSPPFSLVQFDLTAANIPAAFTDIAGVPPGQQGEGLMLAHDCKIYMAKGNTHYIDVINYPDIPGTGCGYLANAVNLGTATCQYELPNNIDGLFAGGCSELFVKNPEGDDLQFLLYPDPVQNYFFIQTSHEVNNLQIVISDFTGKEIFTKTFSRVKNKVEINLKHAFPAGNISSGIYFVRMITKDKIAVRKFVKE